MILASRLLRLALGFAMLYFTPAAEALGRPEAATAGEMAGDGDLPPSPGRHLACAG